MCYNQTGNITTLDGASLRLVDKFTYLGSSVSSTENDIDTRLTKAWTAIDRLAIIWKSDLTDEMKRSFFQAAVVSILLYGCTTWTLTKRLEKKLDGNYTRMLRAILNKSWRQHPTRRQLYGHLLPIMKTIQVRRTRHAGHCWRSKDELVSDVLLWTPTYGQAKAGRPARTYIQQLCEDTGCNPEDLPEAMNDREKWREMVKDIRAGGTTWWWWWWYISRVRWIQLVRGLAVGGLASGSQVSDSVGNRAAPEGVKVLVAGEETKSVFWSSYLPWMELSSFLRDSSNSLVSVSLISRLLWNFFLGGARGVMVIVAGIGHGDTSSNPGLIVFHIALIPLGKVWIQLFSL